MNIIQVSVVFDSAISLFKCKYIADKQVNINTNNFDENKTDYKIWKLWYPSNVLTWYLYTSII